MKHINGGEMVAVDAAFKNDLELNLPINKLNHKYTFDEVSKMTEAWYKHIQGTWELLVDLKIPDQKNWMVKIEDAGLAANLMSDLIEMSCYIPYQDKEMDMRLVAYNALIVCPDNYALAKFFK